MPTLHGPFSEKLMLCRVGNLLPTHCSVSIRRKRFAEENHSLRFRKTQRTMHRVTDLIVNRRIRRKLNAAALSRPNLSGLHEHFRYALRARKRRDVDAFEKRNRRRTGAVHVITAQRNFNEAQRRTIVSDSDELTEALRLRTEPRHIIEMKCRVVMWP